MSYSVADTVMTVSYHGRDILMKDKIAAGLYRVSMGTELMWRWIYMLVALYVVVFCVILVIRNLNLQDKIKSMETALHEDHVPQMVELLEFKYDEQEDKNSIWAKQTAEVLRQSGSPVPLICEGGNTE